MKSIGIVAEYNPFHNGHKYQIEKSREITGADVVVAAISGNFVQRGMPAVYDKWKRAEMAVKQGVDLVVEIPTIYACNSAEYFAKGAVKVLEGFGSIDYISFGSECGDIEALSRIANVLKTQDVSIHEKIQDLTKKGLSYPRARVIAVEDLLSADEKEILKEPNNILAIEYLKNIKNLRPMTIKRSGDGYHETATKIREKMINEKDSHLKLIEDNYFKMVTSKILQSNGDYLEGIISSGQGLGNKIKKEIRYCSSIEELINAVKSKVYTYTRISRFLTQILLGITEESIRNENGYIRILAFNKNGADFLKNVKKNEMAKIPIITNINKDVYGHEELMETINYDVLAGDMYNLIAERNLYKYSDFVVKPYLNLGKPLEK